MCRSVNDIEDDKDFYYPREWLKSIEDSGLPQHRLVMKKGMPVMLMRNLAASFGHYNGSRYIVDGISNKRKVILCRAMYPLPGKEKMFLVPRMTLKPKTDFGFQLKRHSFRFVLHLQ